jgi:hypothetical protein
MNQADLPLLAPRRSGDREALLRALAQLAVAVATRQHAAQYNASLVETGAHPQEAA